MINIYEEIANCVSQNKDAALCIITSTKGSTPGKPGAKMIVYSNGSISGSVGGGNLEKDVIGKALKVLKSGISHHTKHNLTLDHNMSCGGEVDVYIEPLSNPFKLYIFGAGHIGAKLAEFAVKLNFNVVLIDERKEIVDSIDINGIVLINKNHNLAFDEIVFDENCLITTATHLHEYDREIIAYCAKQPYAYLGMLGSKRKIETAKKIFLENNILSLDDMEKIDWPMGVPIECNTIDEIVISILARLIDIRGKLLKTRS